MPGPGCQVLLGLVDERLLELRDSAGQSQRAVAQVEPQVGGHLVVAGPAGAQLAAERAELLSRPRSSAVWHVLVLDAGP
jgi:hypothetical protein